MPGKLKNYYKLIFRTRENTTHRPKSLATLIKQKVYDNLSSSEKFIWQHCNHSYETLETK